MNYFAIAGGLFVIWMGMSVARTGQRSSYPTARRNLQLIGGAQAALGLGVLLIAMDSQPPAFFLPLVLILVILVPIMRHLLNAAAARDDHPAPQ
ncbi:MAG TPA: hypothetical protein VNU00_05710 [Candidatus Binataceae bacterium]|jgi:hypothetical protein|nr:hypothetical protein [Candidatus Binataceae bacterium]